MAVQPSTAWRETIDPGEEERFRQYAAFLAKQQASFTSRYATPGRALHRKQLMALPATLTVLDDLPEACRHGLFAVPATYEARVRLSNGGPHVKADKVPDIRGFAIKVLGIEGEGALGNGPTDCQDFLLINQPTFGFGTGDRFAQFMMARARGGLATMWFLFRWKGLGMFSAVRDLQAKIGGPFSGFATEPFHSAAPLQCGPYAVKVRLQPTITADSEPAEDVDWAADFERHLAKAALAYELQLQFFVDEAITPIEDGAVAWPEAQSPFRTVARLTIEPNALTMAKDAAFAQQVENAAFDPWRALADHRPLGNIMRARKATYYPSYTERTAAESS